MYVTEILFKFGNIPLIAIKYAINLIACGEKRKIVMKPVQNPTTIWNILRLI